MSYAFHADTRVEPLADGVLGAAITDRWNALGERPNGGYLLGICLQALRRVLPFPDPLTVAAFFLRPARPGPAEVRTEVVRAGRRLATGEARLLQEGAEVVRAVATFTELAAASGRTLVLAEPPDLPPPDETVDVLGGQSIPGLSLVDRFEYRMAGRPGWAQGRPSGDPRVQLWLRFRDGLEVTAHVRARPASGWLACRVSTRYVIGGYHEEDFEVWDSRSVGTKSRRRRAKRLSPPARRGHVRDHGPMDMSPGRRHREA